MAPRSIVAARGAEDSPARGIYVYSFPHYLRYPLDPRSGRTFLGVAFSGSDAYLRAAHLGSLSVLPEAPVLLRIYPAAQAASLSVEKRFKEELGRNDQARPLEGRAGAEWFVTSIEFLDRIARDQGLEVRVMNGSAVADD